MSYTQYAEPYPDARGDGFGATAGRSHSHRGQDTAPGGLPALALADGILVENRWSTELGHVVVLEHADGKYSGYAHLAAASTLPDGARIKRAHTIGATIGATGTAQTGRHLHYTLGNDRLGVMSGHVEDPLAYIRAHSGPETATAGGALYTATETDGKPGKVCYMLAQLWARDHGYRGPIDGILGVESWRGVQTALRAYGYAGPIDGIPGVNTYKALQRLAHDFGYRGPIDGILGPNTWRGVARFLNRTY